MLLFLKTSIYFRKPKKKKKNTSSSQEGVIKKEKTAPNYEHSYIIIKNNRE
jgi:hypothetical protein